ncbi:MAG: hypothetical protein ACLUFM_03740, partial [Lachnospiraceae bacterium]
IMFKPFAGEVPEGARFKIRYIAFFADEAAAAAFESKDKADYLENYYLYTNVNYEEVTSDTVDGYLAAMRKITGDQELAVSGDAGGDKGERRQGLLLVDQRRRLERRTFAGDCMEITSGTLELQRNRRRNAPDFKTETGDGVIL